MRFRQQKANAGPVSLAHKGLPLPHCMQDILPSNLRKNFSYLAFWPCSITASHSKTVSQSGPLMKLTHIMSKFFCKSQHYSGENTTIILVDKVSQGACPTWDNCCESHQFNPGIYTSV